MARCLLPIGCAALALSLAACGGGGSSGAAAHALGKQVVVKHTQIVSAGGRAPTTMLGVTVLKVRKGSQAELRRAGFTVDAKAKSTMPYYVDVRYANKGAEAIKRTLDVGLEDQHGNLITATTIFNFGGQRFAKCPKISEGQLMPGKSYQDCTLFLVPKGSNPAKISFLPYDPKHETQFVYWKAS
jgi:hypothetical protein